MWLLVYSRQRSGPEHGHWHASAFEKASSESVVQQVLPACLLRVRRTAVGALSPERVILPGLLPGIVGASADRCGRGPRPDPAVAAQHAARHPCVRSRVLQAPHRIGTYADHVVAVPDGIPGGLDPTHARIRPAHAAPSTAGARLRCRPAPQSAVTTADGRATHRPAQPPAKDTKSSSTDQDPACPAAWTEGSAALARNSRCRTRCADPGTRDAAVWRSPRRGRRPGYGVARTD